MQIHRHRMLQMGQIGQPHRGCAIAIILHALAERGQFRIGGGNHHDIRRGLAQIDRL